MKELGKEKLMNYTNISAPIKLTIIPVIVSMGNVVTLSC